MAATSITVTLSKPDLVGDLADRHRDPRDLMLVIGATAMSGMLHKLRATYLHGDDVYRSGDLMRTLQAYGPGQGGSDQSIFELESMEVAVGSSLPYAAVQGIDGSTTIRPKTGKALAIPTTRAVRVKGLWPRDYPRASLYFRKNTEGGGAIGWLFDATENLSLGLGDGPLFMLVGSVTIKGKGLLSAGRREVEEDLDAIYDEWIEGADA